MRDYHFSNCVFAIRRPVTQIIATARWGPEMDVTTGTTQLQQYFNELGNARVIAMDLNRSTSIRELEAQHACTQPPAPTTAIESPSR
jgi:hypothetical protein